MSCLLLWTGEMSSTAECMQLIETQRKMSFANLTVPSQRRYIHYFSKLMDGVKPESTPVVLKKIVFNTIPVFGALEQGDSSINGCCPFIQIFKNGKLLTNVVEQVENSTVKNQQSHDTSQNSPIGSRSPTRLKWMNTEEGSLAFESQTLLQGDIVVRCRHVMAPTGSKVKMFSAAFHTGYIPSTGVLRLLKEDLDGANDDNRFNEDFYIDLIFSTAQVVGDQVSSDEVHLTDGASMDKYEADIHKDSNFWETMSARKAKGRQRKVKRERERHTQVAEEEVKIVIDVKESGIVHRVLNHDIEIIEDSSNDVISKNKSINDTSDPNGKLEESETEYLQNLEKELGLEELSLFTANSTTNNEDNRKNEDDEGNHNNTDVEGTSNADDATVKYDDIDVENLEELEKYIDSIATDTKH